ncbi:hypothetical protein L9F63_002587, partial [Diploptera punctata]
PPEACKVPFFCSQNKAVIKAKGKVRFPLLSIPAYSAKIDQRTLSAIILIDSMVKNTMISNKMSSLNLLKISPMSTETSFSILRNRQRCSSAIQEVQNIRRRSPAMNSNRSHS